MSTKPTTIENLDWILEKDTHLIDEGLRRLIEGICCLEGENQLAALDLFSKVRWAIEDHIRIEDGACLSIINDSLALGTATEGARLMLEEHRRIEELICKAQKKINDAQGSEFRLALHELVKSFDMHHANVMKQLGQKALSASHSDAIERIQLRSDEYFIG